MAIGQGTVTFDFGSAPGTNIVTTTVSSPTIGSTSKVDMYLMGTDSTADHNQYEHSILALAGLALSCISISAGSGFTAQAATTQRLTGTIVARYVHVD